MKYLRRFEKCLVNPTWDQVIERDPLLIFSLYLSGRVNVLFLVAKEILENLDQAFDIRMPAAKMERAGKKQPMNSNRSPSGWDFQGKDLLIFKSEPDSYMSARFILSQFDDIFSSFTKEDVLKKHEESYQSQA